MLFLPNKLEKSAVLMAFTLLLCAIFICSCDFVDLRPVSVNIEPNESGALLAEKHSPVILHFNTEMDKKDAEGILQISSDLGVVKGDYNWESNSLYFTPTAGWTAGVRYTLSLAGIIRAVDGRELRLEKFISFYAVNKNEPPLLVRHSPVSGESISVANVILEFYFSKPMDKVSVESAFSIDGITNKTFEWDDDDKLFRIISANELNAWTLYKWTLKENAKSVDGVPLPCEYSSHFITDLDKTLPRVVKIYPVLNANGRWYPTGSDIETGLGIGHTVAVDFNKPMSDNALNSLRFEPSLSGRTELLSDKSIVYIFTRSPDPQTTYTLTVSGDTKDNEGLKIGQDYKISFIPDIPYLDVLSFKADGNPFELKEINSETVYKTKVDSATGIIYFTIRFSLPFTEKERQNTALRIMLNSYFPNSLFPVAIQYARWISDDQLRMGFEGLMPGTKEKHFYKLTIPGGKNGISSDEGIYMKEDISFFLEAINE